jgi:hypothetical protein
MQIKVTISDKCGAHCTTCPQWSVTPRQLMTPAFYAKVLDAIWPHCHSLCVNGSGDYLSQPNHQEYSDVLAERMPRGGIFANVTTVGGWTGTTPRITASAIYCSLNATTPAEYDQHVGVAGGLEKVVDNFRALIATHGNIEVHSLKWEGNPHPEENLLRFFGDTHARIRISEKVENQLTCAKHVGIGELAIARIPCDYLNGLTVLPDGRVRMCVHDWSSTVILGDVWDIPACLEKREPLRQQHREGIYPGVCASCNYNVDECPPIYYIKG